jgi:hypothetical protein
MNLQPHGSFIIKILVYAYKNEVFDVIIDIPLFPINDAGCNIINCAGCFGCQV